MWNFWPAISLRELLIARNNRRMVEVYIDRGSLPGFDPEYYTKRYPDIDESGVNPLTHYLEHGWIEGRDPSPGFSTSGYIKANPDVKKNGLNPLLHFLRHGISEGRGGWQAAYAMDEHSDGSLIREDVFSYYRRKALGR